MPIPNVMSDLSTTAASNYPTGSESPTTGDDYIRAYAAILRATNAKGADIASATTTDIGAATGEFVDVTGTTTITGLGTIASGIRRVVRFTGALTLTYNATSLILPGNANITTANGDVAMFRSLGSGNWVCTSYIKRDGSAIIGVTQAQLQAQTYVSFTTGGTSTAYTLTPTPALSALATGQRFNVTFNATAGATPTLAISGLTAKNLKYYDNTATKQAVTSTQIVANLNTDVVYDGTDYLVLNPAGVSAVPATNTTYTTGTATNEYLTPAVARARNIVQGTSVATTSGTSIDFTGIPTWVKRITVMFNGFSTNGTSSTIIQIGPSGGVETTGYLGNSFNSASTAVGNARTTTGAAFTTNIATAVYNGFATLCLVDATTNTWAITGMIGSSTDDRCTSMAYIKPLAGTLSRVRITTVIGTDTFDAGSINILYE